MELRDIIIRYRRDNDLSQREFAKKCGLSHGAISAIEKGINPNTGEKIKPSWNSIECIAEGMGVSVSTLAAMAGRLTASAFDENPLPELDMLNASGRYLTREFVLMLSNIEEYKKKSPADRRGEE